MPDPTPDAIREAFEEVWRSANPPQKNKHIDEMCEILKPIALTYWLRGAAWAAAHKEQDDDGR